MSLFILFSWKIVYFISTLKTICITLIASLDTIDIILYLKYKTFKTKYIRLPLKKFWTSLKEIITHTQLFMNIKFFGKKYYRKKNLNTENLIK